MRRISVCLATSIALFCTPFAVSAGTSAHTVVADVQQGDAAGVHTTNGAGLSTILPAVDPDKLAGKIKALRTFLQQREEDLTEIVDNSRLGAKGTLLTAIMPGGLLYAAYKKSNLQRAKTELALTTALMDDLAPDLLAMQEAAGKLTIVRLP